MPDRSQRTPTLAAALAVVLCGAIAYASYQQQRLPVSGLRADGVAEADAAETHLVERGPAVARAIVSDLVAYAASDDSHRMVEGRLPSEAYFKRVTRVLSEVGRGDGGVQNLMAGRLLYSDDYRVRRVGTEVLLATNPEEWLGDLVRVAGDRFAPLGDIAMAIARAGVGESFELLSRLWSQRSDLVNRGRIAPAIGELGDARFVEQLSEVLRHTVAGDRSRRHANEYAAVSAIAHAYDRLSTGDHDEVGWSDHSSGVFLFDPAVPTVWRFEDRGWHWPYRQSPCLPRGGQKPPSERVDIMLGLLESAEAGGLVIERERVTVLGDVKLMPVPGSDWLYDWEAARLREEYRRFDPSTDTEDGPVAGSSYALPLRKGRNWFFAITKPTRRPMFFSLTVPDDEDGSLNLHHRVAPSGVLLLASPGPLHP